MHRHAVSLVARCRLPRPTGISRHFATTRSLASRRGASAKRSSAKPTSGASEPSSIPPSPEFGPEPIDPRPPWLYSTSSFLRVLAPPVMLGYAVFFHDFGDREHVFQPPRRWLQRQKEAFFTLSPEEERLASSAPSAPPKSTSREKET